MDSSWRFLEVRGTPITADTQATGVSIATWFLTSTFLIMYFSGQTVKYVMLRRLRLDDYLMLFATILAFGMSLAYSIAASNGLGNRITSPAEFDVIQKALYAADILYILTVCCVKLSILGFIHHISTDEKKIQLVFWLMIFIVLSAVASIFAAAFQCQTPRSWETLTLRCFNQSGFWIAFSVLDMLTDTLIIIASAVLVWNINIPTSRKAVVIGCFAPRILVVAAAACRLAYLAPISPHQNPAFRLWISVVCTEVQVCLSISTACIPSVKPLFEAIEAGVWQADDLRRRGLSLEDLHSKGYLKDTGSLMELADHSSRHGTNAFERISLNMGSTFEASELSRVGSAD
ncbi:hypothetical protein F4677DRAFT_435952 [Hypoxylon crocopeplum]|nr:hypothetical protein F4677DRAFT_435952 [Hypoxylon crocopeplum]